MNKETAATVSFDILYLAIATSHVRYPPHPSVGSAAAVPRRTRFFFLI
jgi:hypothetical protein